MKKALQVFILLAVTVLCAQLINGKSTFDFKMSNYSLLDTIKKPKIIDKRNQQEFQIIGKIVSISTGEVIPYCSLFVVEDNLGTSSNEEGEFVLNMNALPKKIIISHLNYETKTITIDKRLSLLIQLEPLVNELKLVTIKSNSKKDHVAIGLAKKAFFKTYKLSTQKYYGKAIYRQKSKNDDRFIEFSEIIYDIQFNSEGISHWDILEGRYAMKSDGVKNRNYTLLSKLLKTIQPETDNFVFPLNGKFEEQYNVFVVESYASNKGRFAVLRFKPIKQSKVPLFRGDVTVNVETNEVYKVKYSIENDDVKLIGFAGGGNRLKKNYKLNYEIVFKKDNFNNLIIDYVNVDQQFDFYLNGKFETQVSTTSNLSFFEYYKPTVSKRLGGQFRRNKSDWQKLNEIGYNTKFWEENPIVKRTEVEQELIDSFEAEKSFESIFLNDRESIVAMQSNISNEPFIITLSDLLNEHNQEFPIEKVYLHTSKDVFVAGEDLWYSAYTVLGTENYFSVPSKALFVDFINAKNEIIETQKIGLRNGRARGNILTTKNMPAGEYQIRAYTNWMRNFDEDFFFTKKIKILNSSKENKNKIVSNSPIDLQFFPEGGNATVGLNSKIAFKAIQSNGLGVDVQGSIINSKGKQIVNFKSIDKGAGFFNLIPKPGETYKAVLNDNSEYPLPFVLNEGYSLNVNNIGLKSVEVNIQATKGLQKKTFYVIGHLNNVKYYQGKFNFYNSPNVHFEISKRKIPSGVFTLTLFDEEMKPWCERVLFINNENELAITTVIDKKKFEARDKIVLNVNVSDTEGRPVPSELSIAITDADKITKNFYGSNLVTNMLLEAGLKGHIDNPGVYFNNPKRAEIYKLDLIMLTNGWRKFNWSNFKNGVKQPIKYNFTNGFSISGVARNSSTRPLANITLKVIANSRDRADAYVVETKSNGSFTIENVQHNDITNLAFIGFKNGRKIDNLKITLDKDVTNKALLPQPNFKSEIFANQSEENKEYIETSTLEQQTNFMYAEKDRIELNEVNIVVEKKIEEETVYDNVGITPDNVIKMEEYQGSTFLEQLSRVGGVSVMGAGRMAKVSIRGFGSPLWVVDGVAIYDDQVLAGDVASIGGELPSPTMQPPKVIPIELLSLNTDNIASIEVYKGGNAAKFGMRANNGVIVIHTKKGSYQSVNFNVNEILVTPYVIGKEFYSPKYQVNVIEEKPDYRTLLYWNPYLKLDDKGNATIEFFNSDITKEIQISIEGLSIYGTPGAYLKTYGTDAN